MSEAIQLDAEKEIGKWLNEYGDDMYSWAFYKTSNKETAEDLVQETFLSSFKSFEKYKPGTNPKTWLFTILNNKIIDYYRSSNTQKSVSQTELLGKKMEDENFDQDGLWSSSPVSMWANEEEHLLDNTDFLNVLNDCIDGLPQNWRNVIVSKYMDHKKGNQICQELDITPSNLWQMAHRAKLQLKGCLDVNWQND